MNETKPWWQSGTLLALIAVLVIVANHFFGFQLVESEIQEAIEMIGVGIASLIAMYRRKIAIKRID